MLQITSFLIIGFSALLLMLSVNSEVILPRGQDKNNIFKSVRSAFIKAGLSHCFMGVKLL